MIGPSCTHSVVGWVQEGPAAAGTARGCGRLVGVDVTDATSLPGKTCTKCGEAKPVEAFYRDKRKRDGRVSRCKPCANADRLVSVAKNQEHYRRYLADWHTRHAAERNEAAARRYQEAAEERRAQIRAWGAANPERRRASARRAYLRNREAVLERTRERARRNPEVRAEQASRRRARIAGAAVGVIDLDALWVTGGGVCYLCGGSIDRSLRHPDPLSKSLDHIFPLVKGGAHSQANLAWVHLRCNVEKGASDGTVRFARGSGALR